MNEVKHVPVVIYNQLRYIEKVIPMIFTINKKKNTTMSEQFEINRKMVETGRIDTHNTQIHDRSRSWLIYRAFWYYRPGGLRVVLGEHAIGVNEGTEQIINVSSIHNVSYALLYTIHNVNFKYCHSLFIT